MTERSNPSPGADPQLRPATHFPRPQFLLFTKMVGGFGFIILFMVGASLTVLLQLNAVLSNEQSELKVVPLIQYMARILEAEHDAAIRFFQTNDNRDEQKLLLAMDKFQTAADSLLQLAQQGEGHNRIAGLAVEHKKFATRIRFLCDRESRDSSFHALSEFEKDSTMLTTMRGDLHAALEDNLPSLGTTLHRLTDQMSDARSSGFVILFLSLAVGGVFALLFTRALTRPIQSLKAATGKIAEGNYETIPVTTTDEVADLTRAFNMMSTKLKQLDEMRMQLMSEISHEMRTPLQVIKAGCYSIIHTKDGPSLTQRQRDAVGMIHQATNRINQFVNSFLDIAKMEAGLMKFNFENQNIADLLNPLVQEAQLIAQTRGIEIVYSVAQIPPIMLDKERMSQVFSNLLSNALKYTPDAGRISICVTKAAPVPDMKNEPRGSIQIDVQDTGVGIPDADLKKLFQKFYQAKNVPLVNEKGSGLGLALVKHVVEAHGGVVSVKSQVGAGSTFTVMLPA